jgi:hypothetical protein
VQTVFIAHAAQHRLLMAASANASRQQGRLGRKGGRDAAAGRRLTCMPAAPRSLNDTHAPLSCVAPPPWFCPETRAPPPRMCMHTGRTSPWKSVCNARLLILAPDITVGTFFLQIHVAVESCDCAAPKCACVRVHLLVCVSPADWLCNGLSRMMVGGGTLALLLQPPGPFGAGMVGGRYGMI